MADTPCLSPLVFCPMGLASILDHIKIMLLRDCKNGIHVRSLTIHMNGNNGLGSWSNGFFKESGIHRIRLLIDIDKYGLRAAETDRLSRRHERHWNGNDFVFGTYSQRKQCEPQRISTISNANRIWSPTELSKVLLKPFHERPTGKCTGVDDVADCRIDLATERCVMGFKIQKRYLHGDSPLHQKVASQPSQDSPPPS